MDSLIKKEEKNVCIKELSSLNKLHTYVKQSMDEERERKEDEYRSCVEFIFFPNEKKLNF